MRALGLIALASLLAGCGEGIAYYKHPQSEQTQVCTDSGDPDKAWVAAICLPCYFAEKRSAYADCKTEAERNGFVRSDR